MDKIPHNYSCRDKTLWHEFWFLKYGEFCLEKVRQYSVYRIYKKNKITDALRIGFTKGDLQQTFNDVMDVYCGLDREQYIIEKISDLSDIKSCGHLRKCYGEMIIATNPSHFSYVFDDTFHA